MSAALVSKCCTLSVTNEEYKDVTEELIQVMIDAQAAARLLHDLIDKEAETHSKITVALQLEDDPDDEIPLRDAAIRSATQKAMESTLEVAYLCTSVLDLAKMVAIKGDPQYFAELGVASSMACGAVKGAAFNLHCFLADISDPQAYKESKANMIELEKKAEASANEIEIAIRKRE